MPLLDVFSWYSSRREMVQGALLALPDPGDRGAVCLGLCPAASLTVFLGLPLPCVLLKGAVGKHRMESEEEVKRCLRTDVASWLPHELLRLWLQPGAQELALPGWGDPVARGCDVTRQRGSPCRRHGRRDTAGCASRDGGARCVCPGHRSRGPGGHRGRSAGTEPEPERVPGTAGGEGGREAGRGGGGRPGAGGAAGRGLGSGGGRRSSALHFSPAPRGEANVSGGGAGTDTETGVGRSGGAAGLARAGGHRGTCARRAGLAPPPVAAALKGERGGGRERRCSGTGAAAGVCPPCVPFGARGACPPCVPLVCARRCPRCVLAERRAGRGEPRGAVRCGAPLRRRSSPAALRWALWSGRAAWSGVPRSRCSSGTEGLQRQFVLRARSFFSSPFFLFSFSFFSPAWGGFGIRNALGVEMGDKA